MDPEPPDWVVLGVDTNLNTRLVVLPSRTDTIADVRALIKVHHMNSFPDWGEVDVTAVEVDLFGGRSRVADLIVIGRLFYGGWLPNLFVELTPSNSEQWLTGVADVKADPERQNSDEGLMPRSPGIEGRLEGRDAPEVGCHQGTTSNVADGACNDSNHRPPATDYRNLGPSQRCGNDSELPERQLAIMSSKEERDNLDGVGESQANDRVVTEVPDALTKKTLFDRGKGRVHEEPEMLISKVTGKDSVPKSLNVVESRLKSSSTDGSGSRQQCDHLAAHKVQEVPNILIADPSEKHVVDKSSEALEDLHESYAKNGSFCRSQTGHAVAEKVHEGPDTVPSKSMEKDFDTKIPLAKESEEKSSTTDGSDDSGYSGHPPTKKVMPSKPTEKESVTKSLPAKESSGSDGSDSGFHSSHPLTEKVVPSKQRDIDLITKSPLAKESEQKSSSTDGSNGSGHSGPSPTAKECEGPGMVEPAEKYNVGKSLLAGGSRSGSSGSDTSGRSRLTVPHTGSQQRRNTRDKQEGGFGASIPVKEVPTGGTQDMKEASKRGTLERGRPNGQEACLCNGTTSGDITGKSTGQSEELREKAVELQGKNVESQGKDVYSNDGKILESNKGGGSKSYSSGGSSRGKDCDEEKSEGDSSQQLSGEFESDNLGSSDTDNTDEMPPRVSRRRMDSSIPEDCAGPRRSNSPKSSNGLIDLRSSRDRSGELAAVNQYKLQVSPRQRQELQLVDELRAFVAPGLLADDSLSIDLVQHTHAGGSNGNVGSQDKSKLLTAAEPLDKNVKEIVDDVGCPSVRKDGVPAEHSQDGVDGGNLKSSSRPSSSAPKTGEVCELVEGTTSDDSQQVRAAVQLARMSMLELVHVDHDGSSPYEKRIARKQKVSSVGAQGLIKVRQPAVDVVAKDQSVQFILNGNGKKCGEPPVRSLPAKLLRESGNQRLETTCSSSPEVFMEACVEEHGNVLTMPEATDVVIKQRIAPENGTQNESHFTGMVASDALVGNQKHGKRNENNHGALEEHLELSRGEVVSAQVSRGVARGGTVKDSEGCGRLLETGSRLQADANTKVSAKRARTILEGTKPGKLIELHSTQATLDSFFKDKGAKEKKRTMEEAEKLKVLESQKPRRSEIAEVMEHVAVTKEKHQNLKTREKQSKPIVAVEMEQLDNPAAFSLEDEPAISRLRTEMETSNELTLKKRQKKMRGLRPKPPPNDGHREGGEVQSVENAGHEAGRLEQEDHVEILNGSNGNVRKRSRDSSMLEDDSLREGNPILVPDMEEDTSKNGELLRGDLDRNLQPGYQVKPAAAKKQTDPKKGKQSDSTKSAKRNHLGRFDVKELKAEQAEPCPYDCGRFFSKKTSAFFRHKKVCLLGRMPKTQTEN